ncbi:hypothetical protein SASPL_118007 [Salvia splendens]|uniref:Pentatricopeptide repeat-containing protein n=1 Tax=Salvia splendens TaxID=180675 RepID=A0A8X8ZZH5_SALSN|nr:hypothetical protein SASPL_118007 [Salvia splendens]
MRDVIEAMNGQDLDGRSITVNEAQSRGGGGAEDFVDLAVMGAVVTDVEFWEVGPDEGPGDEIRERNVVSWNFLLWGYVKCGDLAMALSVFDEMPEKDVVSWTSMVSGYARGKDME